MILEDIVKRYIEETARNILEVRKCYRSCSLAALYDDIAMPSEFRQAYRANDRAVMQAYGFDIKMMESEYVAELMKLYQKK